MILAPVAVLFLLIRGALSEFLVFAARFSLPAAINRGLTWRWLRLRGRLRFVAAIIVVVVPAAGG